LFIVSSDEFIMISSFTSDVFGYSYLWSIPYCQKTCKDVDWHLNKDLFNTTCQDQMSSCLFHNMLDSPTILLQN